MMRFQRLLSMAAFLLLAVFSLQAQIRFEGTVVRVADGDTLTVRAGEKSFRVRLHGIDAPERGQPYAARARNALAGMVAQRPVTVVITDVDRYGRLIGLVIAAAGETETAPAEVLVNLELLRMGLAWHYTDYDDTPAFAEAQREARAAGRGLWSEPSPVPPWEWRRR